MYNKLKSVLEAKGISVYRVAKETNIHANDLYQALKGERKFFNGWKNRIAAYLEMPVEELFEEGE